MPDESAAKDEQVKAAADRRAALTGEVSTDDADAAVRQARTQAPRGRTERPTTTAG